MQSSMVKSITEDFGNGGTIDGDLTISGDLQVNGGGSLSFDEIVQGTSTIKVTDTSAFLIEKADGTDVFVVDTTNSKVTVSGSLGVGASPVSSFPAQNVTIEGATAGLVLRDTTGSNQATQFFTLYSSNGDIIGMFDDSKSLKFGHADDAVGTNYTDVLTLGSDNSATFTGAIKQFRDDSSTVGTNDVVIENDGSGDASLKFSLTGATDWYAYVDNSDSDKFKIRRSTTDHFSIDESGNATFTGDITGASGLSINWLNSNTRITGSNSSGFLQFDVGGTSEVLKLTSSSSTFAGKVTISKNESDEYDNVSYANSLLKLTNTNTSASQTHSLITFRLEKNGGDGYVGFKSGSSTNQEHFVVGNQIDGEILEIASGGNATFAGDVQTGGTVNVTGASSATATLNINANNGASTNNKVRFLKETGAEFKLQMNTGGVSSFANLVNFTGTGTTFNNNVTLASSTSSSPFLIIENTNADDNMGGLKFIKDSASPNTGDKLMQIWAYGDNDYAEQILYSEIATLPTSVADGSEEGSMRFRVMNAGSFVETMRIRGNKVGIGTSSPDNELHITDGSAGSVTANSNSQVTIESNSHASLQFLSPNNANSIIYFGDVDDNDVGYINYAHSSNTMNFQTNAVVRLSIDGSGNSTFAGDVMINSSSANYADLTVGGTGDIVALRASSGTAGFTMYEGGTGRFNMTTLNGSGGIAFKTPSTTRMIIDDNSRISLSNNDGGSSNTIFGKSSGLVVTGSHNVFLGQTAGDDIVEGSYNIAIGSDALGGAKDSTADASDFNIFIGVNSGNGAWVTAVSQYNTGIGHYTLSGAMNGALNNTAVGYQSMLSITTGDNNTAIGSKSLNSAQLSQNNVAVGYLALEELTFNGNSYNTALGVQSGQELTTGIKNTFVGAFSGYSSTDVDNAVVVGYSAGGAVMTDGADGAVAIGTFALDALTSGARNLAVGYNAGTGITTGTDNCLVGWGAGDALLTNASNNTIIGAEAEASSTGASDQIVIGKAAIGQGTNTVVLGKSSVTAIYCARNASASVEASAFNVGSDRKLKKNIRDTALQGINLIEQMQVRDFEWKDNNATVNGGLIAQELEAIYPDAVGKRNDDGDDGDVTMTISRESIVPLLIKAVQELSAKVKELESK